MLNLIVAFVTTWFYRCLEEINIIRQWIEHGFCNFFFITLTCRPTRGIPVPESGRIGIKFMKMCGFQCPDLKTQDSHSCLQWFCEILGAKMWKKYPFFMARTGKIWRQIPKNVSTQVVNSNQQCTQKAWIKGHEQAFFLLSLPNSKMWFLKVVFHIDTGLILSLDTVLSCSVYIGMFIGTRSLCFFSTQWFPALVFLGVQSCYVEDFC
mgnify:CR=1 FL=1